MIIGLAGREDAGESIVAGYLVKECKFDFVWFSSALSKDNYYSDKNIVVRHCSDIDDRRIVKYLEGYLIRVVRGNLTAEDRVNFPYMDYILFNDGTVDELFREVDKMLIALRSHAA